MSFNLCAEWENDKSGELSYEFAALNFLSEPLAFHSVKNQASSAFLNHSNEVDKRHSTIRCHNSEPPLNGTLKSPSTAQTSSIRFNQNGQHINNPKNHTNS